MKALFNRKCLVLGLALLAVLSVMSSPGPAHAESAPAAGAWKFSITPYLWLPNVNGTLKYSIPPSSGGSPEVETGPNDYLQNLQAVIMLSGEARKERWSVFTDVIYLSFGSEDSKVKEVNFGGNIMSSSLNLVTSSTLRGTAWTLGAGYEVLESKKAPIHVFGGLRYFSLQASTSGQIDTVVSGPSGTQRFTMAGGISAGEDLWDFIAGIKGRYLLGSDRWTIPYYFDMGGGSSDLTYQWMIGIAYSFTWGDVTLAYRNLYYDQSDDKLVQNLRFNGPALGATFRF